MKKRTKIILLALFGGLLLIFIAKASGFWGKPSGIKVSTEKVLKRTITEVITANGKIQPETEVKISSDVSGEIVELFVKEGDEVKKGDLLLKIKPDIYLSNKERIAASVNSTKANLANSKARLAQSKAKFEQIKLSYTRDKELYKQKAISKAELEKSYSTYISSKAEVEATQQTVQASVYSVKSSQASLKEANENLNKTSIYAPMSGTVSKLNVEKGERVVGTIQMAGTELLRIANLNKMEVIVEVNENDIVRVSENDTAIIEVDAYYDKEFKGVVTEIANSSNNTGVSVSSDQVTNFDVKVHILRSSYKNLIPKDKINYYPFRPGMSATVNIRTETVNNVLSIPIQSVTTRADSVVNRALDKKTTNVQSDKAIEIVFLYNQETRQAEIKEVKTGLQDNDYIQILSGLNENQEIVTAPYSAIKRLKHRDKIKKTEREELYRTD